VKNRQNRVKYYNNLQLQNDIGLREWTAYRPTSLTVLIEASHKCGRMRRESRPQSPACLMYLAWPYSLVSVVIDDGRMNL